MFYFQSFDSEHADGHLSQNRLFDGKSRNGQDADGNGSGSQGPNRKRSDSQGAYAQGASSSTVHSHAAQDGLAGQRL